LNGDQQAWIELLHRYKRLIYGVTVRFGFDIEDRHDVFQAVCLETLKSLGSLRNASSLKYWILTITVRQSCLLLKLKREERGRQHDEDVLPVQDPQADTMRIYLAAEREKMLHEALEELPEPCRSLLDRLFFSDEHTSYLELGAFFGWSKDTVGSARLRCLDKIRKILARKGL
jgi:RNA polymerase sigma factor (sigma-70 family)